VKKELPTILFADQAAWEEWLEKHHVSSAGVWLKIAKKGTGESSVTYPEALDVALCFGWIDGQKNSFDERFFLQKFTPRGPRSIWSKINRDKVAVLIEAQRMRPAGLAAIEQAKKNGQWAAAYDGFKASEVPPDLQAALDQSPKAKAFFATLKSQNRYAILFRLQTAKKPETRADRLKKFVDMLKKGETIYPQK
jgi:uncharacterized protein YdeI (YjbR/CyaY-like superfamily)